MLKSDGDNSSVARKKKARNRESVSRENLEL